MDRITRRAFGTLSDGSAVDLFALRNAGGLLVKIATYGGIVVECHTPDREGRFADIVLGFDQLEDYERRSPYFGAIIGRCANRIANGRFTLAGRSYSLATNDGPNHLHGGRQGFDKRVWDAHAFTDRAALKLSRASPAGEEGYPARVDVEVTYSLSDTDELAIDYLATADASTPVNLTHHGYFNLRGAGDGDILAHELALSADAFTPVTATLIPTGEIAPLASTPFDFSAGVAIGSRIGADDEQLRRAGGYDHNFVVRGADGALREIARVYEPASGRTLALASTEPGLQFYSGNFLDGTLIGKAGRSYGHRGGFCLEPQHFPDSPNQPAFPSTILEPGETYRSRTIFRFGVC
jgi:aldose 1-epimerase